MAGIRIEPFAQSRKFFLTDMALRLTEQVSEPEYVSKKHILVNRKAELRGKLESFATNRHNRFEPAMQFVLEAKHASKLLSEGNPEQKRDFLKKIGSNFQVAEKSLAVELLNPWQFVAEFNSDPVPVAAPQGENQKTERWRRGRDSNPRWACAHTTFPMLHIRPLCHLSMAIYSLAKGKPYHAAFFR